MNRRLLLPSTCSPFSRHRAPAHEKDRTLAALSRFTRVQDPAAFYLRARAAAADPGAGSANVDRNIS